MLGFVIVSHREQQQLLRLVNTLNRLYGDPPIVCHHDFGQAGFATDAFPSNVKFVRPHVATAWAKWSIVEAALRALALLYDDAAPDWFVLLSAADYPIKPAANVLAELEATPCDAFLDFRDVGGASGEQGEGTANPMLGHFETDPIRRMKWKHYLAAELWFPILRRRQGGGFRIGRYTLHLPFARPGSPYSPPFRCWYGDQWLTGNRKVADLLLNPGPKHMEVQRHLRKRSVPDETYYQTVLCNAPDIRVCRDNKRYSRWNGGGAHPQELTTEDLQPMLSSGAHFARKFTPGAEVLDSIDEILFKRHSTQS